MALDFTALQTELAARGFTYLADAGTGQTRLKRWLVDAMHAIDDMEPWPYLQTSSTGTSPLTITDLGTIEKVVDGTNTDPLVPTTRSDLLERYGELATTGTALFFYMVGGAITAYPVTTNTLTVYYRKVGPDLSAGGDVPLMPDRFRMAIVERAAHKAYLDGDDGEMARECLIESDLIVDRMRAFYLLQPGGQRQEVYGHSSDW